MFCTPSLQATVAEHWCFWTTRSRTATLIVPQRSGVFSLRVLRDIDGHGLGGRDTDCLQIKQVTVREGGGFKGLKECSEAREACGAGLTLLRS